MDFKCEDQKHPVNDRDHIEFFVWARVNGTGVRVYVSEDVAQDKDVEEWKAKARSKIEVAFSRDKKLPREIVIDDRDFPIPPLPSAVRR